MESTMIHHEHVLFHFCFDVVHSVSVHSVHHLVEYILYTSLHIQHLISRDQSHSLYPSSILFLLLKSLPTNNSFPNRVGCNLEDHPIFVDSKMNEFQIYESMHSESYIQV